MRINKIKNIVGEIGVPTGLSKDEVVLLSCAGSEKERIITAYFARKILGSYKKAANILTRLSQKGRLIQIQRGKYFVVPLKVDFQPWHFNAFVAAKLWMADVPYYIGYATMFYYWGFIQKAPAVIFVLNTKRSATKVINGGSYKAVKIAECKYYGTKTLEIAGEVVCVSDKERTLVDFFYACGQSIQEIKNVVSQHVAQIDMEKFIRYLTVFPVAAVRKRAGYVLEQLGVSQGYLAKIQKTFCNDRVYSLLDSHQLSRKGKLNKTWRVIVARDS